MPPYGEREREEEPNSQQRITNSSQIVTPIVLSFPTNHKCFFHRPQSCPRAAPNRSKQAPQAGASPPDASGIARQPVLPPGRGEDAPEKKRRLRQNSHAILFHRCIFLIVETAILWYNIGEQVFRLTFRRTVINFGGHRLPKGQAARIHPPDRQFVFEKRDLTT